MSKQMVIGSVEWLELQRAGVFDSRPPILGEPPQDSIEAQMRRAARQFGITASDEMAHSGAQPRRTRRTGLPAVVTYLGEPCPYCENPMVPPRSPTRDHLHPRSLGGTLGGGNCVIACRPCNQDKSDMTLAAWARKLAADGDPRAPIVEAKLKRRMKNDRRFLRSLESVQL